MRNLRFQDQDTDAGQIGGTVYWERPTSGDYGFKYAVYLAQDTAGTTKTLVANSPLSGGAADTSAFSVNMDTSLGANQYLIVYLEDAGGTKSNLAYICILDNTGGAYEGLSYQFYITTLGYTKATNVRSTVVSNCYARYQAVTVEMVATANADLASGGSAITEVDFDNADLVSETATFLVTVPSSTDFATLKSAISSDISDAPIPMVAVGGSNSGYSNGLFQMYSRMGSFIPVRPDPDIARYFARSCAHFRIASPILVTADGWVRVQTIAANQAAVNKMANVWLGEPLSTSTITWTTGFDADSSALTDALTGISSKCSNSGDPVCYQVSGQDGHQSCTSGAPV